jgi:F0F1-type ATP synthase assembly protein I
MSSKLIWGILGGVVIGAAFGAIAGNTPIGIAICIAAGAIAAYVWERMEARRKLDNQ